MEAKLFLIIICTVCACLNVAVLTRVKSKAEVYFAFILLLCNVAAVIINSKALING